LQIRGDAENIEVNTSIDEKLKVVIILGNPFETVPEIQQKIKPAQLIVHIGAYQNSWSEIADVVLPGQYYSEKKGTFTNKLQHVQAIDIAIKALRRSRPEWQILVEIAKVLGKDFNFSNENQVFAAMAKETKAFLGLSIAQTSTNEMKLAKTFKDSGMELVQDTA